MNRFEELTRSHNQTGFDCGVQELNDFFHNLAHQNLKKGLSKTFVLTSEDVPEEILSFYTLSIFEVSARKLPKKFLKKYKGPLPAVKIARLAVAKALQSQGLGKHMIINAIRQAMAISKHAGIVGLFVDAKNKKVKEYYLKFGFIALPDHVLELFLPLKTLQTMYVEAFEAK
ncbi:MAG: GNAT family N-acetyltransferase [Deltaproteobacteria bacterium]|nr:GNAT family N-acetyltransferase [Deltaproteobacteria bacterium]